MNITAEQNHLYQEKSRLFYMHELKASLVTDCHVKNIFKMNHWKKKKRNIGQYGWPKSR